MATVTRASVLVLLAACATTRPGASSPGNCDALKGSFEGTLPIRPPEAGGVPDEVTLRLAIAGNQPRVHLRERGTWMEIKSGTFQVRCLGPSALVHSLESARDADGTWVETWVLAVTVREPDALMARWIRMVNNVDLPLSNRSSKFSSEASGTLRRVSATADRRTPP